MLLLSLLGLKGLLSKQWTGKGFDRDLSQLLDLLYLEQSSGKGEMQVLKFNKTFACEILVPCDLLCLEWIYFITLLTLFKACVIFSLY